MRHSMKQNPYWYILKKTHPKIKTHNPTGEDHISFLYFRMWHCSFNIYKSPELETEGKIWGLTWMLSCRKQFLKILDRFQDREIQIMTSQAALLIYTPTDEHKLSRICTTLYLGLSPSESTVKSSSEHRQVEHEPLAEAKH